jgi:hypothetical protein
VTENRWIFIGLWATREQKERFHSLAAAANVGKRHAVKAKCDELKCGGRQLSEVFNQHTCSWFKMTIFNDLGFNASLRNQWRGNTSHRMFMRLQYCLHTERRQVRCLCCFVFRRSRVQISTQRWFSWLRFFVVSLSLSTPQIRPRQRPSKSLPIHYFLIIVHFRVAGNNIYSPLLWDILVQVNRRPKRA